MRRGEESEVRSLGGERERVDLDVCAGQERTTCICVLIFTGILTLFA